MVRCLATESRVVVSRGKGAGELSFKGFGISVREDGGAWRSMVVMGTQQRERTPCR